MGGSGQRACCRLDLTPQIHVIAMNIHSYPRHPAMPLSRTDRISSINPLPSHDPLLDHESRVSDAFNDHTSPSPSDTAVAQIKRRRTSDSASDYSPIVKRPRTKEDNRAAPFNSPNANNASANVIDGAHEGDDPESLPRLTIRIPAPRTILSRLAECANSEKKLKTRVESPVKKTASSSSSSKSRSDELNYAEDEADFVCGLDGCTQRFKRKYDVNRHRKRSKRHGEKLPCGICAKKLSRQDSLRRHMQTKHGVVWSGGEEEGEDPVQTKTEKRRGRNARRFMSAEYELEPEDLDEGETAEREASICLRRSTPEKMKISFVMNPTERRPGL
ncbi:hypothetical protein BDZ89DRAFT_712419 [Hymenopellis radicata]|nr:hypothetical protein BDZ89DRAFT_712419 [Hymenopellis radicata]